MQSEHVAFGIVSDGDKAVLSDRHLVILDAPACGNHAARFDSAILASEVHQRAIAPRLDTLHLRESTGRTRCRHFARKLPHLQVRHGTVQLRQRQLQYLLIEGFRPCDVLHVNLEPDDGIVGHCDSFLLHTGYRSARSHTVTNDLMQPSYSQCPLGGIALSIISGTSVPKCASKRFIKACCRPLSQTLTYKTAHGMIHAMCPRRRDARRRIGYGSSPKCPNRLRHIAT